MVDHFYVFCVRCGKVRQGFGGMLHYRGWDFKQGEGFFRFTKDYYLCDMCCDSFDSWVKGEYGKDKPKTKDIWDLI